MLLDEISIPYLGDSSNNKGPEIVRRTDPQDSDSELETTLVDSNTNLEGLDSAKEKADAMEQQLTDEANAPKDEGLNWFDSSNPENAGLIYTLDGEMLQSFSSTWIIY